MGLDNAGKTVAAKNLAGEDVEAVVPTIGFSIVHLSYRDYKVALFDLGGGSNIRGIWNKYFVYVSLEIFICGFLWFAFNFSGSWCYICCGFE